MLITARLMIAAASQRKESRGVHSRSDYPRPIQNGVIILACIARPSKSGRGIVPESEGVLSRLMRLEAPGPVLTDGAWGTEFQKRGLAIGEPADLWNLTRAADVEAVAWSYVEAGSRVILTNTFRGNPVALSAYGLEDRAFALNRRGAELSKRQAGGGVRVFASLGPTGKVMATGEIDAPSVFAAFSIQAEALAEGGADALLFETFSDLGEAPLAVRAAKPTGLPIIVSFAFGSGHHEDRTMTGVDPETARAPWSRRESTQSAHNCGSGPESSIQVCRRLKQAPGLPVWIKPRRGPARA